MFCIIPLSMISRLLFSVSQFCILPRSMLSRLLILYHPMFLSLIYRCYKGCYSLSARVLYHTLIDAIKATNPRSSNVLHHNSIDDIKAAILCQPVFCIILLSMLSMLLRLHHPMFCIINVSIISRLLFSVSQCFLSSLIDVIKTAILCQPELCIMPVSMLSRLLILYQ